MNKHIVTVLKNESGQVLLFAVVAMSIALAIGVAVSSRTLSTLSRTSRTDTASRVYAAAEGGIEAYLNMPDSRLDELATALENRTLESECPSEFVDGVDPELDGCSVLYEFPGENIKAQAVVSVSKYKFNTDNDFVEFDVANNDTKEVRVEGYNNQLDICWNDTTGGSVYPNIYLIFYGESGILRRDMLISTGVNSIYYVNNPNTITVIDSVPGGTTGYTYCVNSVNVPNDSYGLRIKSLYDNAKVGVRPNNVNAFPDQGFEIISKGELQQEDLTKSVRTIRVFKSLPYLPGVFDNAVYSEAAVTD